MLFSNNRYSLINYYYSFWRGHNDQLV